METRTRRTAALALAVVLCLPMVASAAPAGRDRDRDPNPIVRVISKIQKVVEVWFHSEVPSPPIPTTPKPS
jgi:hypothetical protein